VVFHLEGQSAGRFDHVADNLKIFFDRWGKSFDSKKQFIEPKPAEPSAAPQPAAGFRRVEQRQTRDRGLEGTSWIRKLVLCQPAIEPMLAAQSG